MVAKEVLITEEGILKLQTELEYLRMVRRHEVIENVRLARERGGTIDNAEYDYAKHELGQVEGRILAIESMVKQAVIMEGATDSGKVSFGSKVLLLEPGGQVEHFTIVGCVESNPAEGKISYESPVGRALLEHSVGDEIEVPTPGGIIKYTIAEIS